MPKKQSHTFEQILEKNKEKIFRICKFYATAPLEPKDLFQEVVFQLWKSFRTFEGHSSINTWVYRIALNVCLRSKLKLEKISDKTVRLDAIQITPAYDSTDQDEKYKALRDCISTLNESDKSIVILYLDGLAYKEIAQIAGLTENHVAVKMKRIRKQLFNCITQKP